MVVWTVCMSSDQSTKTCTNEMFNNNFCWNTPQSFAWVSIIMAMRRKQSSPKCHIGWLNKKSWQYNSAGSFRRVRWGVATRWKWRLNYFAAWVCAHVVTKTSLCATMPPTTLLLLRFHIVTVKRCKFPWNLPKLSLIVEILRNQDWLHVHCSLAQIKQFQTNAVL